MRLGQGEGGNVILSGQPFEEGSRTCFFVQAGQLWTAASLLQMTNHRLPLDPFPSAASGVQSASPQMAPGLKGCPSQAGTHQYVCLLAKLWALQKHGLWAGSFLTTLPSQENTHFSFKQSAADRGPLHVKYHPTVRNTQVLCPGTPLSSGSVSHLTHCFRMLIFRAGPKSSQTLGSLKIKTWRHCFAHWLSFPVRLFYLSLWESFLCR